MIHFIKMIFKYKACWKFKRCAQLAFGGVDPGCEKRKCAIKKHYLNFEWLERICKGE